MSLTTLSRRDIEQYIAAQTAQPVYFPPYAAALKPAGTKFRYRGIYITDTSKPAWMDASGVWRYADGSAV
ncbi:MAG: hypothetical protein K2P94_18025 [Rhodospirillaceae bacterium]|nr:hypothetical protein [Rhodospirillaceae bacterium]